MDDLKVFEGRQAFDFDKGRERIITTILVDFLQKFLFAIDRKFSSLQDEPFTMLNRKVVGNLSAAEAAGQFFTFDQLSGYCVDLARMICEKRLGIRCKFRIVKDNQFGNKPADDQPWNGMIGELVRHEADLAVAPLTITSQRESVVDFSKPWMNLGISILISKQEKRKPGENKTNSCRLMVEISFVCFSRFQVFFHLWHHYRKKFGCVLYSPILVLVLSYFSCHVFRPMNGVLKMIPHHNCRINSPF